MPRFGVAPPPPIPSDPNVCRWCRATRVQLRNVEGDPWLCPNSCADTLSAPYYRQCEDCRREFNTGNGRAQQCYPCESKEQRRYVADAAGERPVSGYLHERIRQGANKQAMRIKAEQEA